ncbi:putative exoribonuclease Rex4 [Paratrimastix pyriformis]|uniref:RNA exonuclease 4 n=1 Tax=Paratrimastix pyriformis TaxID=342808 RepID=A0ABQ8UWB7_9EUKA|nr:putative exoribonuclease Rex4 [Paratrimastix pyriformis]
MRAPFWLTVALVLVGVFQNCCATPIDHLYSSVAAVSTNANRPAQFAKPGDVVTATFTATIPLDRSRLPNVTLAGHQVVASFTDDNTFTARWNMSIHDCEGPVNYTVWGMVSGDGSVSPTVSGILPIVFDKTPPAFVRARLVFPDPSCPVFVSVGEDLGLNVTLSEPIDPGRSLVYLIMNGRAPRTTVVTPTGVLATLGTMLCDVGPAITWSSILELCDLAGNCADRATPSGQSSIEGVGLPSALVSVTPPGCPTATGCVLHLRGTFFSAPTIFLDPPPPAALFAHLDDPAWVRCNVTRSTDAQVDCIVPPGLPVGPIDVMLWNRRGACAHDRRSCVGPRLPTGGAVGVRVINWDWSDTVDTTFQYLDDVAPYFVSAGAVSSNGRNRTRVAVGDTVTVSITLSEAIDPATSRLVLTVAGQPVPATITGPYVSGALAVTLSAPDGWVRFNLAGSACDALGNCDMQLDASGQTGVLFVRDLVAPYFKYHVTTSSNPSRRQAQPGDWVALNLTASEPLDPARPPAVTLAGHPALVQVAADVVGARVQLDGTESGELGFVVTGAICDLAGNCNGTAGFEGRTGIVFVAAPLSTTGIVLISTLVPLGLLVAVVLFLVLRQHRVRRARVHPWVRAPSAPRPDSPERTVGVAEEAASPRVVDSGTGSQQAIEVHVLAAEGRSLEPSISPRALPGCRVISSRGLVAITTKMDPTTRFKIIEQGQTARMVRLNDQFASFAIRPNPAPIQPDAVTVAFEDRAITKFVRLLKHPSLETRLATLPLLYNHISKHENIIKLIHNDGITFLVALLSDGDALARQRAAAVLARTAAIYAGRAALYAHPTAFPAFLTVTTDADADVRQTIHIALCNMCSGLQVGDAVKKGIVPVLVRSVAGDIDPIKVLALDTLYYCAERIEGALHQSLDEGAMPVLVNLLRSENSEVVEKAGSLLSAITTNPDGKNAAVTCGAIPRLVELLATPQLEMLMACSEALLNITTTLDGQTQAVQAGACGQLATLLAGFDSLNPILKVTVVKSIANLAINPQGRAELQACVSGLTPLAQDKSFAQLAETEPTNLISLDCEMVGCGSDDRSVLARVSMVNYHGNKIYDSFVRVPERITDFRTHVSGITPTSLRDAPDFAVVQGDVARLLNGRVLVGHTLRHDLKALMLDHPRSQIRDCATFPSFRENGRTLGLKVLAERHLHLQIQDGEHDSIQDAQAAMALYRQFRRQWEAFVRRGHRPSRSLPESGAATATATEPGQAKAPRKKKKAPKPLLDGTASSSIQEFFTTG